MSGLGVSLTRASASSMMFCFALLLVCMCRNLITCLRETFLHHFIPFDAAIAFHKYVAIWSFVLSRKSTLLSINNCSCIKSTFTFVLIPVVHSIGHAFNFYAISTQSPSTLRCLFREMYFE
jgi:dual oxidase